jgi:hypothetical protein
MSRMLSLLTVSLAILLVAAPAALADTTVTQTVPPGGSVSLDPPGTAPTPENPIVVTVWNRAEDNGNQSVTYTITKRTTPTVSFDTGVRFGVDIVGPQHDISVKSNDPRSPDGFAQGFATFDVDASLLRPGFYGYPGSTGPSDQITIPGLGSGVASATELPNGDVRYSGHIGVDQKTHRPADVVSFVAQRAKFVYLGSVSPDRSRGLDLSLSKVRSEGFEASYVGRFACEFTLTLRVSQRAATVLGLKSTVIAKGHFEQLPTVHYRAGKPPIYKLRLTSAAKAALKTVPKSVKFIKFAADFTLIAPADGQNGINPHLQGFVYKLIVKAPKKDNGGI